jgi:hypothetical protein
MHFSHRRSVADRMATLKLVFFLAACRTIQGMSVRHLLQKPTHPLFCHNVPHVTMGMTVAGVEFRCQLSDGLRSANISRLKSLSHIQRPRKAQLHSMKITVWLSRDYHMGTKTRLPPCNEDLRPPQERRSRLSE